MLETSKLIRYRVILTKEAAREIFCQKNIHSNESPNQASIRLAVLYHVSSKSVRDIWNGRSWLGATYDLWREEERPLRRAVGRPKGRKDNKPRVRGRIPADNNINRLSPFNDGAISDINHSMDRLPIMKNLVPLQQRRFTDDVHIAPDEASSMIWNHNNQDLWSMASGSDRTTCVLPRFGILMHDMGFEPTLSNPFGPHSAIASPSANPLYSIHCRTFPEPSMFGGASVQGSLPTLVSSHLPSARNPLAVSAAPVGVGADLHSTE